MSIEQLARTLRDAERVVVFTGAGVSAESGIPTFRDALSGLWARFDPSELATPQAFQRDPALVWGWYEWRRTQLLKVDPNPAHRAIANLSQLAPELVVITQNVDDLHERAGSTGVIHLHGSIQAPRCFACGQAYDTARQPRHYETEARIEPPRCEACNGPIRPGVVWFGEALPEAALDAAFEAAKRCDCLLSIGTSGIVQPAARIPSVALEYGATVIHINPDRVPSRHPREFCLQGKAGDLVPELIRQAFTDGQ